jgi:hypothetical protein
MSTAGILFDDEMVEVKPDYTVDEEGLHEETSLVEYSLEDLKQMLKAAVESEDYEKASRVRDEIKKRN